MPKPSRPPRPTVSVTHPENDPRTNGYTGIPLLASLESLLLRLLMFLRIACRSCVGLPHQAIRIDTCIATDSLHGDLDHATVGSLLLLLPLLAVLVAAPTTRMLDSTTKEASPGQRQGDAAHRPNSAPDSFRVVREAAYGDLEKMGKAAVKALEEGAKSEDLEVSSHLGGRLLALAKRTDIEIALDSFLADKDTKLILKLPSYERQREGFSATTPLPTLFVEMYTTEGTLLAALEARSQEPSRRRSPPACQQIQQNLYTPWGAGQSHPDGPCGRSPTAVRRHRLAGEHGPRHLVLHDDEPVLPAEHSARLQGQRQRPQTAGRVLREARRPEHDGRSAIQIADGWTSKEMTPDCAEAWRRTRTRKRGRGRRL